MSSPTVAAVSTDDLFKLCAELTMLRGIVGELVLAAGIEGGESFGLDPGELLDLLERHGAMRRPAPSICRFPAAVELWVQEAHDRAQHPRC